MCCLGDQSVVVGMAADPEPENTVRHANAKCSVAQADPNRPELLDLFEVQGRVFGILFQQIKVGVCQLSDDIW